MTLFSKLTNSLSNLLARIFPRSSPFVIDLADRLIVWPEAFEGIRMPAPGFYTLKKIGCPFGTMLTFSFEEGHVSMYSMGEEVPLNRRERADLEEAIEIWADYPSSQRLLEPGEHRG